MCYQLFIKSQLYTKKSVNLHRLGFDFSKNHEEEYYRLQNLLNVHYHSENGSMLTIMKKYSIPSTRTMDSVFRIFSIVPRSLSDAQKNSLLTGRSNSHNHVRFTSKQQWHKSWDNKSVFLRSSYELNYAKYLDKEKIKYDVESLRISYFDSLQNKYRVAIPDFYLPETNTIVEIKSTYWLNEENMEDRRKEYQRLGFNFQLIVDGNMVGPLGLEPRSYTLKG